MELEFIELKYHKKFSNFFHGTRVHRTQVPKSGRSLHIFETIINLYIFLVNNAIVTF